MASVNSFPLSVYPIALPQEALFGHEIFMTSLQFLLFVLLLHNNRMHERVRVQELCQYLGVPRESFLKTPYLSYCLQNKYLNWYYF